MPMRPASASAAGAIAPPCCRASATTTPSATTSVFWSRAWSRARELLAPHGTLYFHIDYREAHYCKLLLDEVFGRDAFLNEIIWAYDYGAKPRRRWPAKHDTILAYVRTPGAHHFDADAVEREPYMAPGLVGPEKAARGKRPTDVWFHTIVPTNGAEKTGYPTQKPMGVLRRLVAASSRPGGWCLDPFAGSGTLGAVCRELGPALCPDRLQSGGPRGHAGPAGRSRPPHRSGPRTSGTNLTGSRRSVCRPPGIRRTRVRYWCSSPTGATSRPPGASWASRAGGMLRAGGRGDVDGVKRRLLGQPLPAVADDADHVGVAQPRQRDPRLRAQLRVALHRPHLGGQQAQQGGVIPRPGADVEHPVRGRELQQLEHPRHHHRLRDGLRAVDRQGRVLIGPRPLGVGHEAVTGHRGDGVEHPLVVHRPRQQLRESLCRVHPRSLSQAPLPPSTCRPGSAGPGARSYCCGAVAGTRRGAGAKPGR